MTVMKVNPESFCLTFGVYVVLELSVFGYTVEYYLIIYS